MEKYYINYIKLIKESKTDEELMNIIDKIYNDGYEDSTNDNIDYPFYMDR
jgi:hypothetical protein